MKSAAIMQKALPPPQGQRFAIVNPCTDFGFKKAFGSPNDYVLINFLNHILDYKEGNIIVSLIYMDDNFFGSHSRRRDYSVDIVCQTQNSKYIFIDMQNYNYTTNCAEEAFVDFSRFVGSIDRVKLEHSTEKSQKSRRIGEKDIATQEFWQQIEEICTLGFSNKRINLQKEKYADKKAAEPGIINTFELRCTEHLSRHLGNFNAKVVLVMIDNFHKTVDQLMTDQDRWLFALKDECMATDRSIINPFKFVDDIEKVSSGNDSLKHFYTVLSKKNIHDDLLYEYVDLIQTDNERIERNFNEGMKEGIKKAMEKGVMESKRKMASTMLANNVEDKLIIRCLDITLEELEGFKNP